MSNQKNKKSAASVLMSGLATSESGMHTGPMQLDGGAGSSSAVAASSTDAIPRPPHGQESESERRDSAAIQLAVKKRRDLWDVELEKAINRCTFVEKSDLPPRRKNQALKKARHELHKILWIMHISGIADQSEGMRALRTDELRDLGEAVVSDGLAKLDTALVAVGFVPIESRLQVVTEQYPSEPPEMGYYHLRPEKIKTMTKKALNEQWDAAVKSATEYSKRISEWTNAHGRLLLNPDNPARVLPDPTWPDPGVYEKAFKSNWFPSVVNIGKYAVKSQESEQTHVTWKPIKTLDQASKPKKFSDHHPLSRSCFVSKCQGCGGMVTGPDESVVVIPRTPAGSDGSGRTEQVYLHSSCVAGTRHASAHPGPASSTSMAAEIQPNARKVLDCFLPVCDKCGEKISEPDGEVVRIQRPRIAPGDEVKLQADQLQLSRKKQDEIKAHLRLVKKTVYFHYDCSPGYIGYCLACNKPLLDGERIVRFQDPFIFHFNCLESNEASSSAAGTGGAT